MNSKIIEEIQKEQDELFMKYVDNIVAKSYVNRVGWDDCFMSIASILSMRSLDPDTKCGAIVVSPEKDILTVGYNSPPRDCDDDAIPLTRPEKYSYMAHAEENCIVNASRLGVSLKGGTIYVTSYPCERCFRMMRNAGISRIVYFAGNTAHCVNEDVMGAIELMNRDKAGNIHISIEQYNGMAVAIESTMQLVVDYMRNKNADK